MNAYAKALADFYNGPSQYAWIIDKDKIGRSMLDILPNHKPNDGVTGPSDAPDELVEKLRTDKSAGHKFRMLDDDGEVYYYGRYIGADDKHGPDSETAFGPLTDFGTPNDGAVTIQYRNADGKYVTL